MMKREDIINDFDENQAELEASIKASIWCAIPAIIQSVDYEKCTCTAQPSIRGQVENEQGEVQIIDLPLLLDVPICMPHAQNLHITLPVAPNDECLVVFSSRCIDAWWQSGGIQNALENRMLDLSDGIAILAPYSLPKIAKLQGGISKDSIKIVSDDAQNYIELKKDGAINIFNTKDITINTSANINANAQNATITCNAAKIDSPNTEITGALLVKGSITGQGGLAVSGGSGATVQGSLVTTGDVQAGNISLQSHVHGGVQGGNSDTGAAK